MADILVAAAELATAIIDGVQAEDYSADEEVPKNAILHEHQIVLKPEFEAAVAAKIEEKRKVRIDRFTIDGLLKLVQQREKKKKVKEELQKIIPLGGKGAVTLNGVQLNNTQVQLIASAVILRKGEIKSLNLQNNLCGSNSSAFLGIALSHPNNNNASDGNGVKTLNLSQNRIMDLGCAILCDLLSENSTLESFLLESCQIGVEGAIALGKMLTTNTILQRLDLKGNVVDERGAQALGVALKSNIALTHLNLTSNKLGDEAMRGLAEGLQANIVLKELILNQNKIGDNGMKLLSKALRSNQLTLTVLELQGNKIGTKGAIFLATGLGAESGLRVLRLNDNVIGPNGAKAMGHMLARNKSLEILQLAGNKIEDSAGPQLAAGLSANSSLVKLDLSKNLLSDGTAAALGEALANNETLTELLLSENHIADDGAHALMKGAEENTDLTRLVLARNNIGDEGGVAIQETLALGLNQTIENLEMGENPVSQAVQKRIIMVNDDSMLPITVDIDGADHVKQNMDRFGARIANTETHTKFAKFLLLFSMFTSWFDLTSDIIVVSDLRGSNDCFGGFPIWFAVSLSFVVVPILFQVIFLSKPGAGVTLSRWKLMLLNLTQTRVLYETYLSWYEKESTLGLGTIRLAETITEAGPQSLLQLHIILYIQALKTKLECAEDEEASNLAIIALSVGVSLVVFSNTMSDLFEKQYVATLNGKELEGWALFKRMIPAWIYHLASFGFRAGTLAILTIALSLPLSVALFVLTVLFRFFIWYWTKSKRGKIFVFAVTFIPNSAWDTRLAARLGALANFLEGALLVGLLWIPDSLREQWPIAFNPSISMDALDKNIGILGITIALAVLVTIANICNLAFIEPTHPYTDVPKK